MSDSYHSALDAMARWRWWTGIRYIARFARRRMGLAVFGIGATFFPSRDALNQSRDFNEFLGTAESIDAVFVSGRVFIQDHHDKFRRIKRVILPDPESASFQFYASSTGGETDLAACVRRATIVCRDQIKMEVRWCPELIQQSILIGDSDKRTGWVHAELVMPCSKANTRPSFTVRKSRYEFMVRTYQEVFERLWVLSKEPPRELAPALEYSPIKALAHNANPADAIVKRLLAPGWMLNFNPDHPRGRKPISFNADGTVGEGSNPNEFIWRMAGDQLQIIRQNGSLQNYFRYEPNTDRFVCTNSPRRQVEPTRGNDDQIIYRAEIK